MNEKKPNKEELLNLIRSNVELNHRLMCDCDIYFYDQDQDCLLYTSPSPRDA